MSCNLEQRSTLVQQILSEFLLAYFTQCSAHLATGYDFDYVFDWTVLKYKQGQKTQVLHQGLKYLSFIASTFTVSFSLHLIYHSLVLDSFMMRFDLAPELPSSSSSSLCYVMIIPKQ